jgi:hypothetical protein
MIVHNPGMPNPNPPSSPILTHLLHRKSPAPDQLNLQVKPDDVFRRIQGQEGFGIGNYNGSVVIG